MDQYRQGDVLLIRVDQLPSTTIPVPREGGRIILAEGELTGHAHVVEAATAELLEDVTGLRFLSIKEPGRLVHEEHAAIGIDPGIYRVVRQREYVPPTVGNPEVWSRRVAD